MTFRLGLCAGLLLLSVLPVKGQDLDCRIPLTRLSVIADTPLPRDLLLKLQKTLTGTCAERALMQSLAPELARFLTINDLRPVGSIIDHDAGQQRAILSLNFQNGAALSRYLLPIERPAPVLVRLAELVGKPQEGETLRLRFVPAPNLDETNLQISWLRDGAVIDGATGHRYQLSKSDIGARISLRLEAEQANAAPVTTKALGPVTPRPVPPRLDNLRLIGRAEVGRQVTLNFDFRRGSNAAPLGRIEYQWLRDNAPIADAEQAAYTLQEADIGRVIRLRARAFDAMGMAALPVQAAMSATIKDVPTLDMVRPIPRPLADIPEDNNAPSRRALSP